LNKKFMYSFGATALAIAYMAFSTYIMFFYVDVMKLPVRLAGLAILIYAIWNAVNDPLAGFISDNTKSRWGRRLPYLIFSALPLCVIFFLLWIPPFNGLENSTALFIYFLILICLFDGLYTLIAVNWTALFPEMFQPFRERININTVRQGFWLVGLLIGVAVPPFLYSAWGWWSMGLSFSIIILLLLLMAIYGSRERKEFSLETQPHALKALRETINNKSFIILALGNLLLQYSFTMILAVIPFFAKYILKCDQRVVSLLVVAAFLAALPMLFVWKRLALRYGAKNCLLTSMAFLFVWLAPLLFIDNFYQVVFIAAMIGAGVAGFILVADVMLADVIDEDELNNGVRREGMYFGMNNFFTRLAIGLEAFSLSAVFVMTGHNSYVFTQSREFYVGLRILIAGLPMIALASGFAIMLFYPLAGRKMKEMGARVEAMHLKKGVEKNG